MSSKYRFTISDYHSIKDADILIDGITVVSGENGSGKSTLSRWLYYLVNGAQGLDKFAYEECTGSMLHLLSVLDNVVSSGISTHSDISGQQSNLSNQFRRNYIYWRRKKSSGAEIEELNDLAEKLILQFGDLLSDFLNQSVSGSKKDRVLAYLHLDVEREVSTEQVVSNFIEKHRRLLSSYLSEMRNRIEKRPYDSLLKTIESHYRENDAPPQGIQLYEDGVALIHGATISALLNLRRAIYVDTPVALSNIDSENVFWNELQRYSMGKSGRKLSGSQNVLSRIHSLLHGEAQVVVTDELFSREELRFVSEDGKVNIPIEKVATGFKTFSYLQRLVECNLLNESTLLLLDEPEAHLHPQWVVEYARLLVLLHKELGLKVMIDSHNPDMVAAIRAIAEKEGVLESTHFYLSAEYDGTNQYVYKDLGHSIGEIFSSFNIALSRIEEYGVVDL